MIDIYGIALSKLPQKRRMIQLLDERFYEAWRERHRSIRDERAVRTSLAGPLLLQASGVRGELFYDEKGRPSLRDRDVDFNITHTEGYTFCAMECPDEAPSLPEPPTDPTYPDVYVAPKDRERLYSGCCRVGVDAENLSRLSSMRVFPLASRWFSEREEDFFLSLPNDESFLRVWTRKEALVKWLGTGISALRSADTVTAQSRYGVRFYEYRVEDTVVTLCCHAASPRPPRIRILTDTELLMLG